MKTAELKAIVAEAMENESWTSDVGYTQAQLETLKRVVQDMAVETLSEDESISSMIGDDLIDAIRDVILNATNSVDENRNNYLLSESTLRGIVAKEMRSEVWGNEAWGDDADYTPDQLKALKEAVMDMAVKILTANEDIVSTVDGFTVAIDFIDEIREAISNAADKVCVNQEEYL